MCGGVRAQYANEPVAAPEFRTDEIAVRAQCFAQGGDVNLEVLFRYYDARPHPVEKLLFCDERAVGLQQDQKEVEGARAELDRSPSASSRRRRNSTRKRPNSIAASALTELHQVRDAVPGICAK
jgi:hypothetical protein